VEDPAEQIIPGIMQTEVNEARGLDYARAARHLLRQDPQVLVLGEIRDEETALIAVRAALTGHLVISTLHAVRAQACSNDWRVLSGCVGDCGLGHLVLNQRWYGNFALNARARDAMRVCRRVSRPSAAGRAFARDA